jgi:hypothetical protein
MTNTFRKNKHYEFHKYCLLFPKANDDELSKLRDDIRENGLIEPITVYEGKILDGRNRFLACTAQGITPTFKEYEGTDPLRFVLSKNFNRRHLSESQRAAVAAEVATLPHGRPLKNGTTQQSLTQSEAAKALNVSERLIRDAKTIKKESLENFNEIKQGKKTVHSVIRERRTADDKNLDKDKKIKQVRKVIFSLSEKLDRKFTEYHGMIGQEEKDEFLKFCNEIQDIIFNKY